MSRQLTAEEVATLRTMATPINFVIRDNRLSYPHLNAKSILLQNAKSQEVPIKCNVYVIPTSYDRWIGVAEFDTFRTRGLPSSKKREAEILACHEMLELLKQSGWKYEMY